MSKIEEVRERLEAIAVTALDGGYKSAVVTTGDIRALLADHARLQNEADAGRINGWRMVDGLRVFTASGHTPGTAQEFVTLSDHARLQAAHTDSLKAMRQAVIALAHAQQNDPVYLRAYGVLDMAIEAAKAVQS